MKQLWNCGMIICLFLASCDFTVPGSNRSMMDTLSSVDSFTAKADSFPTDNTRNLDTVVMPPSNTIYTNNVQPEEVVSFAKTLIGTPYVYGSTNPNVGFDCSGFITYVFNHFGIKVPRSSIDFTDEGRTIAEDSAKAGDLILFTGTNPAERHVGHMGIVVSNTDTLEFIHSTSGKAMGVTITPLSKYYQSRFVKVIRVFNRHP
jgi:cell wall-associated NlpC family hydrolase